MHESDALKGTQHLVQSASVSRIVTASLSYAYSSAATTDPVEYDGVSSVAVAATLGAVASATVDSFAASSAASWLLRTSAVALLARALGYAPPPPPPPSPLPHSPFSSLALSPPLALLSTAATSSFERLTASAPSFERATATSSGVAAAFSTATTASARTGAATSTASAAMSSSSMDDDNFDDSFDEGESSSSPVAVAGGGSGDAAGEIAGEYAEDIALLLSIVQIVENALILGPRTANLALFTNELRQMIRQLGKDADVTELYETLTSPERWSAQIERFAEPYVEKAFLGLLDYTMYSRLDFVVWRVLNQRSLAVMYGPYRRLVVSIDERTMLFVVRCAQKMRRYAHERSSESLTQVVRSLCATYGKRVNQAARAVAAAFCETYLRPEAIESIGDHLAEMVRRSARELAGYARSALYETGATTVATTAVAPRPAKQRKRAAPRSR